MKQLPPPYVIILYMNQHFLQSSAWEKYEQLEGHKTFRLETDDFSALAILHTTPIGNYLFCPYGPTLKNSQTSKNSKKPTPKTSDNDQRNLQKPLKIALDSLSQLAREQNCFFVRIEPTFPLSADDTKVLHLYKSHDLDPAHTWIINLTQPRTNILKQMRTSSVQYWHSSAKKGLKIRQTTDPEEISTLVSLLQTVSEKDHFQPQTASHLKNQLKSGFATLYIAEYTPENPETATSTSETPDGSSQSPESPQPIPLAASLVYDDATTRFYAHAATSDKYRKINAGIVILIQMILDAKDRGATTFDFWGITTSEDPNHPWYGFTKFKKSFGGHPVTYAGTWDLPLSPLKYRLYQIIRRLNRLGRKLLH